ncbi:hypothetical protein Tco_0038294 [Tanacetum coccineum]
MGGVGATLDVTWGEGSGGLRVRRCGGMRMFGVESEHWKVGRGCWGERVGGVGVGSREVLSGVLVGWGEVGRMGEMRLGGGWVSGGACEGVGCNGKGLVGEVAGCVVGGGVSACSESGRGLDSERLGEWGARGGVRGGCGDGIYNWI